MEGLPNQERKVEKSEVIEALRTKGVDDPQVRELVAEWTTQQEKLVDQDPTVHTWIVFNVDRADLYLAVGSVTDALECLEDARMQAHQEGEMELYAQIMYKMNELEGGV